MVIADVYEFNMGLEKLDSWYKKCCDITEEANFIIQKKNVVPEYVMSGIFKRIMTDIKVARIKKQLTNCYNEVQAKYSYATRGIDDFPFKEFTKMKCKLDIIKFASKDIFGESLSECEDSMAIITDMIRSRNKRIKKSYERIAYLSKDMEYLKDELNRML